MPLVMTRLADLKAFFQDDNRKTYFVCLLSTLTVWNGDQGILPSGRIPARNSWAMMSLQRAMIHLKKGYRLGPMAAAGSSNS